MFIVPIIGMLFYICWISNRCREAVRSCLFFSMHAEIEYSLLQGQSIAATLHSHQNHHIEKYQNFVRIFSLHIRQQPIEISALNILTLNNALMNSVSSAINND